MQYPLTLSFKILALAPQISVTDANGNTICYVKQKLLKLKENIQIFSDSSQSNQIATIAADRMIDWSARYHFTHSSGEAIGSVGRRGARSIWRAHYDVFKPGDATSDFSITEENPWSKVGDSLVGNLPIIGMFSGYLFHPRYLASRADGTPCMRLKKLPAFLEGKFVIEKLSDLDEKEELNLVFSFIMLNLLERRRG